jgi:pimeloyl-ACP methyl ester carboxylesterase
VTFVLIHGAWHGGWCWARVAEPLRKSGHRVFTPTQSGLAERAHLLSRQITIEVFVAEIVALLEAEDLRDVVLVGHSFGGISVSGVADRVPHRLKHLVYLDAFIVSNGCTPFDMLTPEVVASRRRAAQESSDGLSLPVPEPKSLGVTEPKDVAWLRMNCTPHPLSTYESRVVLEHEIGNGLPATYVAVTPPYRALAESRAYARTRRDWDYAEIVAGHDAMVTSPRAVVLLLERIVRGP